MGWHAGPKDGGIVDWWPGQPPMRYLRRGRVGLWLWAGRTPAIRARRTPASLWSNPHRSQRVNRPSEGPVSLLAAQEDAALEEGGEGSWSSEVWVEERLVHREEWVNSWEASKEPVPCRPAEGGKPGGVGPRRLDRLALCGPWLSLGDRRGGRPRAGQARRQRAAAGWSPH